MKNFLLSSLALFCFCSIGFSQTKTLGVGVSTPNPNAALHVDSPTGNQGFLMPKLTTTQRTAMASLPLTSVDAGLMVYDTNLNGIYIWDGTQWATTAKISYPVNETIENTVPGGSLFRLVNSGTTTGNFGVASFENENPNTGFSALYVRTVGSTNGAMDVVVNNAANNNDAIGITTNGVGTALRATSTGTGENAWFEVNNPASSGSPVVAVTNGIGLAGLFTVANKTTGGTALMGTTNSDLGGTFAPAGVYGESTGAGSVGGAFRASGPANTYPALYSETNGQGSAASFKNINAFNGATALTIESNGTGGVGYFRSTNSSSSSPAIQIENLSEGAGAYMVNNNSGSTSTTLYAENNGNGSTVTLSHINNGVSLQVINGGVRYNVLTVPSAGSIAGRSTVYDITTTGTFNLGWLGTTGDVIYVYNSAISSITFEGQTINPGVLSQFIYINSAWRIN